MRGLAGLLAAALLAAPAGAEPLRNWFDDPFVPLSSALPDCPEPLGPRSTEAGRLAQAHHRAERGTSCWLSGACDQPNDYAYDRGIAEGVRAAATASAALRRRSTLWLTVQGRVVFLEGCTTDARALAALQAAARHVPRVRQVVAAVRTGRTGRVPYRTLQAAGAPGDIPRDAPR